MVLIPYSNILSYPKVVSPHNGHGRLTNRRYPGVRCIQYGVPETLHPALPGPEDRIVDFPEGKIACILATLRSTAAPGRNTPQCYTKPLDSLKNWNNRFFWVDERVFPTVVDWRTNAPKDGMPAEGAYSIEAIRVLDTHHMNLFNLIRAPNLTKVKTGSRPRAPHEVPLLTLTAPRVIEMDEPAATDSSGVPSTIERSPLDFAHEAGASDQGTAALEMPSSEDVPATAAPGAGQAEETAMTDPPAALKSRSSHGGKSLAAIQLGLASTVVVPEDAHVGVSDPDPLSFADAPSRHPVDVFPGIAAVGDPESESASSPAEVGSPGSVYQPEWGVTNGSLLNTPEACQDLVDHVAPPGYFFELRHMHNEEFLRKSMAQVARRDKRIQARELEIRNLEASLDAKANAKRAAEDKSVATLQQQVSGKEKLKVAFEEFKRQQDERVEQRCRRWVIGRGLRLAVMKCGESLELRQAFANAVSAGIAKGLSEVLRHGLEHGQAQRSLESIEVYDLEAEAKFVAALQALKDLKYPLVDQLKGLRDAPMDVIMAALYLESDTGDDASQDIRDLRPSSSQLTILVYLEVCDPRNPWACKEEIGLADVIAANISRAEKKRKCRIVCRTHGVGSAHHARSDGVPVSAPTMVPQGLALLLADAVMQTESDDT
nr:hypothetical protein [Tanacetum cinerariifolium]